MEYLSILFLLLTSAIFLEWKYKIHLYDSIKERMIATSVFFFIGVGWDTFAIWRGHWAFPNRGGGLLELKSA